MNKLFAKTISILFNPVAILVILPFILIFKTTNNFSLALYWFIVSLIFLLAFAIIVLIGIEKNYFSDLDISNRKQRSNLYTISIIFSSIYILLMHFFNAPSILYASLFGLLVGLISMDIINQVTKASVHTAVFSAFATGLTLVFDPLFIFSFALLPLIAWARIKTHNHTKRQAIIGSLMGILITLIVYVIFKYIL